MELPNINEENPLKDQHVLTLQQLENLSEPPTPLTLQDYQSEIHSNIIHPLSSSWPLPRVLTYLSSNNFSTAWQKTFKSLNISGSTFLDLGSGHGGRGNFAVMHQFVYPRLKEECEGDGTGWDQAREREEGKRLRRGIRQLAKGEGSVGFEGINVEISIDKPIIGDGPGVEKEVFVLHAPKESSSSRDTKADARAETPKCAHDEICKLFFEGGRPYYCCPRSAEARCDTLIWRTDFKDPVDDAMQVPDQESVKSGQAFVKISQLQGGPIPKALLREALDEIAAIDTAESIPEEWGLPTLEMRNESEHLGVEIEEDKVRGSMISWVLPDVPEEEEEYDLVE